MTITELAREARQYHGQYRYWFEEQRKAFPVFAREFPWEPDAATLFLAFRGLVMAPIREYSGRLRQVIEGPQGYFRAWHKEFTKPLRDEWRQAMSK